MFPVLKISAKTYFLSFLIGVSFMGELWGQPLLSTYESSDYVDYGPYVYSTDSIFHTSVRPYMIPDLRKAFDYDSITDSYKAGGMSRNKFTDIVFNRNLIRFSQGDFKFTIDPLFNGSLGMERESGSRTWNNTRGALVQGSVGEKFAFSTRFYETQTLFPIYTREMIQSSGVIPGQGDPKSINGEYYDYANASGYISYTPGKYFNFQLGHGKHFLGDGYRSFILSDHAMYYPYFRINSTIWRFKYVNMWAQFNHPSAEEDGTGWNAFPTKYGTFHYLSFLAGKRWNISLFEAVIWQTVDSSGYRGFDVNYLNPMIFYRPVEAGLNSPDNVLMGANLSFIAHDQLTLYSQFVIDEFRFSEIKAGDGWHGNKYTFQAGLKSYNLFSIRNLFLQAEYNLVRPYMYTHYHTTQSYSHFNEPLAYSFGANTRELVLRGKYSIKRIYLHAKFIQANFGLDGPGENYGKNIFLDYWDRENDYGNYIGQGLETQLRQVDASISFLVNPSTNMNIFAQLTWREMVNDERNDKFLWINFGFRTSLRNLYYDFY